MVLSVEKCSFEGRESQTVMSDLCGALLRGRNPFCYFLLLALEGSGVIRSLVLLCAFAFVSLLFHCVSGAWAIKLMIYISMSGVEKAEIECVARAVLPKFFVEDLNPEAWRVFSSFERKFLVTALPRARWRRLPSNTSERTPSSGHSFQAIREQIFGSNDTSANPAPMIGFVQQAVAMGDNMPERVMNGFRPEVVSVYNTLIIGFRRSRYPLSPTCYTSIRPRRTGQQATYPSFWQRDTRRKSSSSLLKIWAAKHNSTKQNPNMRYFKQSTKQMLNKLYLKQSRCRTNYRQPTSAK